MSEQFNPESKQKRPLVVKDVENTTESIVKLLWGDQEILIKLRQKRTNAPESEDSVFHVTTITIGDFQRTYQGRRQTSTVGEASPELAEVLNALDETFQTEESYQEFVNIMMRLDSDQVSQFFNS